jgi:serine phosphatase RsbU (regulator of sigma subunit)
MQEQASTIQQRATPTGVASNQQPVSSIERLDRARRGHPESRITAWLRRVRKPVPLPLALIPFGAIVLGIFLLDSAFLVIDSFPKAIRMVRDLLFIVGLLLLVPSLAASRFIEQRNVKRGLLYMFWGIVGMSVILGLADLLGADEKMNDLIFSSTKAFFTTGLISLIAAVAALALWLQARSLIYYKSTGDTARNFRLLIIVGSGYIGYRIFAGIDTESLFGNDWVSRALLFIFIFLMVINLRTKWIRHLNRKQKWATLWLGAIVLGLAIAVYNEISAERFREYSIALSMFSSVSFLYFAIYSGMTLFILFLQLPTAGMIDEKMREIQTLHELSSNIIAELEVGNLVQTITEKTMQVTKADAAWLELLNETGSKLELTSAINLAEEECASIRLDLHQGVSGWICQRRHSLLINDIADDERTAYLKNWKSDVAALIGVPLLSKGRVIGVLFSAKRDPWSFDEFDRDMLQAFANQAAIAIDNARLWKESLEKERLAQELRVAHDAQMKLLPKHMPILPRMDVDAISITANEVGGDYFDFFEYPDRLGIVIGDVSGKGPAAAFHMAEVKGIVESYSRIYRSPREVLIHANATLFRSIERTTFVSLIYAQIDFNRLEMRYSRAGHCPIIFIRPQEPPRFLQPAGLALGMDHGQLFDKVITEDCLQLQRDDILVFYTDGVTEAMNEQRREFEEQRLLELATGFQSKNSHEIRETIVNAVRLFVGPAKSHDDYTVVVLKVK